MLQSAELNWTPTVLQLFLQQLSGFLQTLALRSFTRGEMHKTFWKVSFDTFRSLTNPEDTNTAEIISNKKLF